ncbi:TetR/AcrR family transcriptional regulator [Nocardia jiangxiensis]|uniref:TetR/AcrR family transcriptional regulator n=1 Tax=Nocardia jiangxiensis TaxID=282685 RepID=UPI00059401F3|nr:TetR/AcrR family transcriptional regulator [Nocardia jiangxiensis]
MSNKDGVTRGRRRGEELERALYAATLAELADVGYSRLAMEAIAARAQTGKAALYRRWPTKQALVLAALLHVLPPLPEPSAERSKRQNLLSVLIAIGEVMAGRTTFPGLDILGQVLREPELRAMYAEKLIAPRIQVIDTILRDVETGGEFDPGTLPSLNARIGPALIIQQVLLTGAPPTRRELGEIVDALLPEPSPASPTGDSR